MNTLFLIVSISKALKKALKVSDQLRLTELYLIYNVSSIFIWPLPNYDYQVKLIILILISDLRPHIVEGGVKHHNINPRIPSEKKRLLKK
jgi:hypothetical protein